MSSKGTVLVTGAGGFVGQATVTALRSAGWTAVCTTRSRQSLTDAESVYLDLEDPASIQAIGKGPACDAIVHLGARIGWSGESAADLLLPNVLATGMLIELANRWKAHFIFASAAIVHGVKSSQIEAGSPILADTAYGNSKWLAEQLFSCLQSDYCILRMGGVFGLNGPTHLGLNRSIAALAKAEIPPLSGSGSALRNYVYVKDVAAAITYSLEQGLCGTHLLAGSETMSIRDMLVNLCELFAPGQQLVEQPGAEAGDQVITASPDLPAARGFREAVVDMHSGVTS